MPEDSRLFATAHPAPELADSPPYNWQSYEEDFIVFESDSDSDSDESRKDDDNATGMDVDTVASSFDTTEMDVDTADSSFDTTETYDDAFKASPESPRVKCLRWDKGSGLVPPYCATAPAYSTRKSPLNNVELGGTIQDQKPSPLRNVALSNVPEWSGPDYPDVRYEADGGKFDNTVDQVRMPASLAGLVRRDYFDNQKPAQHGLRYGENQQGWLRSHWAQMSAGTGRVQVVRYKRSPSAASPQRSRHCPRSSSGDGAANSPKNWFRKNRSSQPSRVLFTTSVEFEANDTPMLNDEDSKAARMAEATERIKNRRSELEQKSWQHALPHRKHCEYHVEPDEFMDRLRARSDYQWGMDKLKESRQGWPIAEPMLDGVLFWQCNTDPVKSSPEDLSSEYAAAMKLWPSKSSEKVKEKRIERRHLLGEKRKDTEISEFARALKRAKRISRVLEDLGLDGLGYGIDKPLPLTISFRDETVADEAERGVGRRSNQEKDGLDQASLAAKSDATRSSHDYWGLSRSATIQYHSKDGDRANDIE